MPPAGSSYSIWSQGDGNLLLDCLLPNGVIIQMTVQKDSPISKIKENLLNEAKKYPMYNLLKQSPDIYVFNCVNEFALKVELSDETKRLCDVRPFSPLLQLIESKERSIGTTMEKLMNAQISIVLGKGLHELDSKDPEVIDFRRHMKMMCQKIAKEKENQDWLEKAMCYSPPDLAASPKLPPFLLTHLKGGFMQLEVRFENSEELYPCRVQHTSYPEDVIKMTLEQKFKTSSGSRNFGNYVLKVCGIQEYLLGSHPLSQFMHLRRSINKPRFPELVVISKASALDYKPQVEPRSIGRKPGQLHPPMVPAPPTKLPPNGCCIYNLTECFSITIESIFNIISLPDGSFVKIRACLYHGGDMLCPSVVTNDLPVKDMAATCCDLLTFELRLQNIPRMARLCFMVSVCRQPKKPPTKTKTIDKKKDWQPFAWANITVFDYKGIMRNEQRKKVFMWFVTDLDVLLDELMNPIGTVESNPDMEEAVCLEISFSKHRVNGPIYYPAFDQVLDVAARHTEGVKNEAGLPASFGMIRMDPNKVNKSLLESLRVMVDRDPLHQLHEQEKEVIWNLRYECREHFPRSLPKLLSCVSWNNYVEVALMQALLQIWPPLSPTEALELLDFQYADKDVRKFAVKCLREMSDSDLCQYLLQFIQVLKYESYLECDLIEFLLQRALSNHKIGHYFFWLLRSEMHVPSVSIRFGLILEAYFRGNHILLAELFKEVEALNSLHSLFEHIETFARGNHPTKEKLILLQNELRNEIEKKYKKSMSDIKCSLNPSIRLKDLRIDECKVMGSKQKPLWLVFQNADLYGPAVPLMYKRGDDLRQDMLILQILHIMDNIWQSEGLDFRFSIYGCLPMGRNEGLIEIVTKASTLAKIQKQYSDVKFTASFNKACLYQWLKKNNPTDESFVAALNEFLMSCAGYCVATYVLGVADRHSDNIMLRENGQLFHIDFGHILGHFKSKYGVKRERVPFVLTSDLVYVICGADHSNEKFIKFKTLCCRAFQVLRHHSRFLITLFMMMMNTGIPEVSCLRDIEYLKDTLVPQLTDEEAGKHFDAKFKEALKSSWKTSIDWMIHNIVND